MYNQIKLDNGLRLITCNMPQTRSAAIIFYIGAGARYESDSEAGVSHFIEHLCFKGTQKRRTSKEISEAIEGVGGIINGGTDKEITTFWCRVASQHFDLALDVLVDLLLNPRFDAKDIDRERQVITEEINMSLDSPRQRVDMLIDELLWPGQPLGRDIAGSKETVGTITRRQMLDFFASRYTPNNTVVSIAGQIEDGHVTDAIHKSLGKWKPHNVSTALPSKDNQKAAKLNIEFRDTEQVHLCLGIPGLSLFHPDRFALDLMSIVLGEGMSSRLFTEIRERQGLAYDIHSYTDHLTDTGAVIIHAGVDIQRLEEALKAILCQVAQLKESIGQNELKKAKEMAKGRLLLGLENSRNVAAWFGAQTILTNQILTIDDIIAIIEAITTDDLKRVASQVLVEEKLNLAVVGPVKKQEPIARLLKL
ncbi:MAG: insulinase family protein [Chloroflexi bacterium]|nr:insulinase family protein [Chloroflexota bacterium]